LGYEIIHFDCIVSAHVAPEIAKAVKIQAINEGISLQAWITEAIMRQLAVAGQEPEPPQGKTA
jgi:predicted HicB family RNase H-like nuclease